MADPVPGSAAGRPATDLWTVYGPDGKRCTVATFYTREQAEQQIAEWQDRQRRGQRPDIDATGLYADVVKGTYP